MGRYKDIVIGGRKFEALLTTRAMLNIAEHCGGDIGFMEDWLNEGSTAAKMEKMCIIAKELINGAIVARNTDISFGLTEGEKQNQISEDYLMSAFTFAEIRKAFEQITEAMYEGLGVQLPKGVQIEEVDEDLKELEREELRKN